MGAAAATGVRLAVDRRADLRHGHLDADRGCSMVAGGRAERGRGRGVGPGREHVADHAARAPRRGAGGRLRPALAAVRGAGLLLHRRRVAARFDPGRFDATQPVARVHTAAGRRRRGAAADVAGHHSGAGASPADPIRGPVGDGRDQPVPRCRSRPGRVPHRPVRGVDGLRPQRPVSAASGRRPAVVAPPADGDSGSPGAVRSGAARRWPLRLA